MADPGRCVCVCGGGEGGGFDPMHNKIHKIIDTFKIQKALCQVVTA